MKFGVYLVAPDKCWRTRINRLEDAPQPRSNAFVALMLSFEEPCGVEWSGQSLFAPSASFERLIVFPNCRAAFQALSTIDEYPEHILRRWFTIEEEPTTSLRSKAALAQSL